MVVNGVYSPKASPNLDQTRVYGRGVPVDRHFSIRSWPLFRNEACRGVAVVSQMARTTALKMDSGEHGRTERRGFLQVRSNRSYGNQSRQL